MLFRKNTVIQFESVFKNFLFNQDKIFSIQDFFIYLFQFSKIWKRRYVQVLEDVSFHIQKGDFVGIMGPNGSGKSTILKLVCQILKPNGGHVLVSEKVAPLLELAAGFHSELTGHENIFLYGSILGMTDIEVERVISFCAQSF